YYISSKFSFTAEEAMHVINVSFVYFAVGCVIMGILSDFLKQKRILIVISYLLSALALLLVMIVPNFSPETIAYLIYATAFFASSNIICYIKSQDYCTPENSGITLGLVLTISTIGSSLFEKCLTHWIQEYVYTSQGIILANWNYIVMIVPIGLIA